jgi:ADP-heptose:LPS heptosyltransferase
MKTKPVIVIVGTLIIGFILGMLTSAQIRYHRLKPVRVYFSEERFREGFYRAIQPDEKQKAKIDLVLDKYARMNGDLQNNFRKELDASMSSFRKELDLNLTKEQQARLKDMDDRRQEMVRRNRYGYERDTTGIRDKKWHNPDGRPFPDGPPPESHPDHDTIASHSNK